MFFVFGGIQILILYEFMKRGSGPYLKSDLCLLSQYRKMSFLDKMVTGNEKCIYNEIPKLRNSWLHPGQLQHWNLQEKKNIS